MDARYSERPARRRARARVAGSSGAGLCSRPSMPGHGGGTAMRLTFAVVAAAARPAAARIPIDELLRPTAPTAAPLSDAEFAPTPGLALPPTGRLHGRLSLLNTDSVAFDALRDDFDYADFATRRRLPPNFSVELTLNGDRVVPVQTGLVITDDLVWNLFFTTGVAWDEASLRRRPLPACAVMTALVPSSRIDPTSSAAAIAAALRA